MTTNNNTPWSETAAVLQLPERFSFGQLLQIWRKTEGQTQQEVAVKLGISKQLLSAYERGVQLPTLKTGVTLAQTLGLFMPQAIQALLDDQLQQAALNTNYTITVQAKEAG